MKRGLIFLSLITVLSIGFVSYRLSYSFFNDSRNSTSNIFSAASVFPTPTPTPTPIAQTLVINELVWDTNCGNNASQQAANYWIELFNGSGSQIDLKDWRFRDAVGATIQISNAVKLVNPGQYVLITKDGSVFSGNSPCFTKQGTPVEANLGGNQDFLPATTGGVIRLEQPVGQTFVVVDRVEYGPTLNGGVLNAPKDQSIARNPNGADSALGDTFATGDFIVDSTVSPGVSN